MMPLSAKAGSATVCLCHAQLQVLEYDAGRSAIAVRSVHSHAAEIWHIAPCPTDAALTTTVYNEGEACVKKEP